jgi:hypothetical protein
MVMVIVGLAMMAVGLTTLSPRPFISPARFVTGILRP